MPQRSRTFAAGSAHPGPRVFHVVPIALGPDAQVLARALVDELAGAVGGHTLISPCDGDAALEPLRVL